jgi:hypothetical protein
VEACRRHCFDMSKSVLTDPQVNLETKLCRLSFYN